MSKVFRRFAPLVTPWLVWSVMSLGQHAHARPRPAADPVVLSFATVGDSRQDPAHADPSQMPLSQQDHQWLQNSRAWSRLMREIQSKGAQLLFFNGDMIMGYGDASAAGVATDTAESVLNSDLVRYHLQASFWRGMVAPLIEAGTYVLPVPGNHEVQCRSGTTTTPPGLARHLPQGQAWATVRCSDLDGHPMQGKLAMPSNEDAWRRAFGDLIIDQPRMNAALPAGLKVTTVSGTAPGAADGLRTPQQQLSYSFDVGANHFTIVNTDPAGADSSAPVVWLQADLEAARQRGTRRFFVFGHKPAYSYLYAPQAPAVGLDSRPATADGSSNRDAFWRLIERFGATYFCGHEHTFHMGQPRVRDAQGQERLSPSWQVLVGSGGSPFESSSLAPGQPATDRYYAFAHVRIHRSGKVRIDAHGFSDSFGPTRLLRSVTLAPAPTR
jgi:hypothetical protein